MRRGFLLPARLPSLGSVVAPATKGTMTVFADNRNRSPAHETLHRIDQNI